ncbi:MAG: exosortase/archaeosortase family protein [Myxococcota bacterium]
MWLATFLLLAAPTFVFLWDKWTRSIWHNGHGMFVPLLSGFLAYHALKRQPVKREEPSAWGFAFLLPALFFIAIDGAIKTELLAAFALILCLPGLSLLLLGPRRTRALAFPFFLTLFMLPVPGAFMTQIHLYLRELTTDGTGWVLGQFGAPVFAQGTFIHLPHGTLKVVEECSGFSALYAAVTVALILAYMARSKTRRAVLLLAAVPLALACNVARIVALAILAEQAGYGLLDTPLHLLSGYITFILTLVALFLLAERQPRGATG